MCSAVQGVPSELAGFESGLVHRVRKCSAVYYLKARRANPDSFQAGTLSPSLFAVALTFVQAAVWRRARLCRRALMSKPRRTNERRADHWDAVYAGRGDAGASWYQQMPAVSSWLIEALGVGPRVRRNRHRRGYVLPVGSVGSLKIRPS